MYDALVPIFPKVILLVPLLEPHGIVFDMAWFLGSASDSKLRFDVFGARKQFSCEVFCAEIYICTIYSAHGGKHLAKFYMLRLQHESVYALSTATISDNCTAAQPSRAITVKATKHFALHLGVRNSIA